MPTLMVLLTYKECRQVSRQCRQAGMHVGRQAGRQEGIIGKQAGGLSRQVDG